MAKTKHYRSQKEFDYIDGVAVPKERKVNKASPARTIAKTISWRLVASGTTFVVVFLAFGKDKALSVIAAVIGVEAIAKMVIYFIHERLWENVDWGKYWLRYGLVRRIKLNYIKRKRKKLAHNQK
jgi:uncharacterized membrane protein